MPLNPVIAGHISSYLGSDVGSGAPSVMCQLARASAQNRRDASASVAEAQVGFGRLGRSRRNTRRQQRRDAAAPYSRCGARKLNAARRTQSGDGGCGRGTELPASKAVHTRAAHAAAPAQGTCRKEECASAAEKSASAEMQSEPWPSSTPCDASPDAKQAVE